MTQTFAMEVSLTEKIPKNLIFTNNYGVNLLTFNGGSIGSVLRTHQSHVGPFGKVQ
jgi:hypothetical protein